MANKVMTPEKMSDPSNYDVAPPIEINKNHSEILSILNYNTVPEEEASFVRWRVKNRVYATSKYASTYYRPDGLPLRLSNLEMIR